MSTPQSVIHICSGVHLDPRYENSIFFTDETAQQEYFAGKVVKTFPAYSYLRKSWPIQVEATMEEAKTWSYLYFQNSSTGKMYYYFITQVEYKNDVTVELTLELDVIQTYLFEFVNDDGYCHMECFVERTHTGSDDIGEHTVDEGLEIGEYVANYVYDAPGLKDCCILVLTTFNPNYAETETPVQALSAMHNNVFSGLRVWAVDSLDWPKWGTQLDLLGEAGFLDGIVAMWMYPKNLVQLGGEQTWDDDTLCKLVTGCKALNFRLPVRTIRNPGGYTPKNNKLFTYPYSFLYVTNNMGDSAVYRYERLPDALNVTFTAHGALSPEGAVKVCPSTYNGGDGYEYGLSMGGFPTCAWDSDVYKMWLAQNQSQMLAQGATAGLTIVAGAVSTGVSVATGNVAGAIGGVSAMASGGAQIAGLLAQKKDMSVQPPQSKGSFSGSVNMGANKQTFTFVQKSVSAQQAKIIDDYFCRYGYKVNRISTPCLWNRQNFTYVKTIGFQVPGTLCAEDKAKITSIFDNGITFWTDGDLIGSYLTNNPPL